MINLNKILLHIEGFAILLLSLYFYSYLEFGWLMFFILLFTPDLSMLGYLIDKKVGAMFYNLVHTYSLSIGVIIFGWFLTIPIVLAAGLILSAHIGMDRMLGFGLKYPTDFKDTHLNRV